jgi:hypothetical protein
MKDIFTRTAARGIATSDFVTPRREDGVPAQNLRLTEDQKELGAVCRKVWSDTRLLIPARQRRGS